MSQIAGGTPSWHGGSEYVQAKLGLVRLAELANSYSFPPPSLGVIRTVARTATLMGGWTNAQFVRLFGGRTNPP